VTVPVFQLPLFVLVWVRKREIMAISAKDQMSKLLDQLMGQNRDGE
jgi:hypothetical protein